ncbi:MAG: hypothetical protein Ta2G_05520 [Termitinemataceae bacterium]|nr:MAG: hypothetical protein Ta2G_05520 [Termitinemataceae bacterium]
MKPFLAFRPPLKTRGVAFIGAEAPSPALCKAEACGAAIICAADSGLITLENAGLKPHFIAGDMDSLAEEDSQNGQNGRLLSRLEKYDPSIIYKHPCDKDLTDTEIVVNELLQRGCTHITLIGGGGGKRGDHFLAICKMFERKISPQKWLTKNETIYKINKGKQTIMNKEGGIVSVFPLTHFCRALSTGLKWELDDIKWKKGSFGISNVCTGNSFTIDVRKGSFLVFVENHY